MSECRIREILLAFKQDQTRSALPRAESKLRRMLDNARKEGYEEAKWDLEEGVE